MGKSKLESVPFNDKLATGAKDLDGPHSESTEFLHLGKEGNISDHEWDPRRDVWDVRDLLAHGMVE